MIVSLKEFQQYCLKAHVAFVSYMLPGTELPVTLFANHSDVRVYKSISDIDISDGFVLSPFHSEELPVVVISKQNQMSGWKIDIEKYPGKNELDDEQSNSFFQDVTFQKYSAQINAIQENILSGKTKKIVLSRTKLLPEVDDSIIPDVFEELVRKYPRAFVYLIHTTYSGTWLGATPEYLLDINDTTFSTMALAGTKSFSGDNDIRWEEKEIKEQAYVADFVRQRLTDGGYTFHESDRETIRAGHIVHLLTMFNGNLINKDKAWKKLVSLLYPSPAIFGTESEITLQLIQALEEHKREYYSGIIGPFEESGRTNLFINLRCMKIVGDQALLFAGGGILDESSAVREWDETEMKFNTLIQVIRNVKERNKLTNEHA